MNFTETFGSLSSMVENFENISQIDISALLGSQAIEIAKAGIIGAIAGFSLIALTAAVVVPVAIKNIAKTPRIIILLAYFAVGIPVFISVGALYGAGKGFESAVRNVGTVIENKLTDEANAHIDEKAVIAVKSEITAAAKTTDTALLGSLSTLKGYSGNPACEIAIQCGLLAIAAPIKNFDAELHALESVDVGETIGIFIFRMEELILIPFWQTVYSAIILLLIPYALIILIMAILACTCRVKKNA